jgi:hypothetical protein
MMLLKPFLVTLVARQELWFANLLLVKDWLFCGYCGLFYLDPFILGIF